MDANLLDSEVQHIASEIAIRFLMFDRYSPNTDAALKALIKVLDNAMDDLRKLRMLNSVS